MAQFTLFYGGHFSQWYRSRFTVDGIEYTHAEQYMMAEKARLFGDKDAEKRIMAASHPKEQKAIGREVKNFNAGKWNKAARDIVYRGNYAKFMQNDNCKKALLASTGTLVEASPSDRVWGIGRGADDPLAQDESTWRGTNWLGEVLTKVREDIIAGTQSTTFNWS